MSRVSKNAITASADHSQIPHSWPLGNGDATLHFNNTNCYLTLNISYLFLVFYPPILRGRKNAIILSADHSQITH